MFGYMAFNFLVGDILPLKNVFRLIIKHAPQSVFFSVFLLFIGHVKEDVNFFHYY